MLKKLAFQNHPDKPLYPNQLRNQTLPQCGNERKHPHRRCCPYPVDTDHTPNMHMGMVSTFKSLVHPFRLFCRVCVATCKSPPYAMHIRISWVYHRYARYSSKHNKACLVLIVDSGFRSSHWFSEGKFSLLFKGNHTSHGQICSNGLILQHLSAPSPVHTDSRGAHSVPFFPPTWNQICRRT